MSKHYIEYWPESHSITQVATEIAKHLQVRQSLGSAVIIAKRPIIFLSAVRKQWMKLYRTLQVEHARTLDPALRRVLIREIEMMQKLRFVAKHPQKTEADVFFVDLAEARPEMLPSGCRTIYAHTLTPDDFGRFLTRAEEGSVIVQYSVHKKANSQ